MSDNREAQRTPAAAPNLASGSDPFALLGRGPRCGGRGCGCGDVRCGDGDDCRGAGRACDADGPRHVLGGAVVLSTPHLPVGRAARKASGEAGDDGQDRTKSDAAYLDAFITAEAAAAEDHIAAEMLSRGEALPNPKSCQTRLEHPNFIMDPELITVYV